MGTSQRRNRKVMTHDLQWFIDRIGKRVFRDRGNCDCAVCKTVLVNGLIIEDRFHANYLYDVQNEMGITYYEKPHEDLS